MDPPAAQLEAAIALHRTGKLQQAELLYRQVLAHPGQAIQANSALGFLMTSQGRHVEARQCYQNVVAQEPGDFLAHKLLADACAEMGDVEDSACHYRNAARARGDSWLWHLRADLAAPTVFASNLAIEAYRTKLAGHLDACRQAPHQLNLDELVASGCKPPLVLAYQGQNDRPLKERFAAIFAERLPADLPRSGDGLPHVGFVVTEGSEGVFLRGMAGLVERLDRRQLKVGIVCSANAEPAFRRAIHAEFATVRLETRMTATLEAIRNARFDLLYYWEIGTDCTNYYLPFFRLAPIQCTSWGWPVTSGIAEVDYFLSTNALEPPGAESYYTETLVRLRHLPNYYPPLPPGALPDVRNQTGIAPHRNLYFCGQNPRKMHPDFDLLMADILRSDPSGIIALIESAWPHVTRSLQHRMQTQLADCYDRIRWLPRMSQRDYLAWMAAADCVLDTPHYCGGANSSYDAFAVAAPVVTLPGAFHRGRYTAAAYSLMGFSELVATSPADYAKRAVSVATERDIARHCRRQITERRDCLLGNVAAVREVQTWLLGAIAQVRC